MLCWTGIALLALVMVMAISRQDAEIELNDELVRQSIALDKQLQQLNNHSWQLQQQFVQTPVDTVPQWLPLSLLTNFPMLERVALLSGAHGRLLVEQVMPHSGGIKPLQNLADLPEVAVVMPYLLAGQAKDVVLNDGNDVTLLSIYPISSKSGHLYFATWLTFKPDSLKARSPDVVITLRQARHTVAPEANPNDKIRASKVLVVGEQRYRLKLTRDIGLEDVRPHLYLPLIGGLLLLLILFVQAAFPARHKRERSTV